MKRFSTKPAFRFPGSNVLIAVAVTCFALLCNIHQVFAQEFVQSQGARAAALGGVTATMQDDYSPLNNQAALAFDTSYSIAVSATRRYWLSELGGACWVTTK